MNVGWSGWIRKRGASEPFAFIHPSARSTLDLIFDAPCARRDSRQWRSDDERHLSTGGAAGS